MVSPQVTLKFNKARFFEASALLFLPHQLEVLDRSRIFAADRNEPAAAGLAAAAFRRISRSIERRDQVWRLINQPQDIDAVEDMLAIYEALLASLMGALDATARLVHVIYRLPGQVHLVGWQRSQWSRRLEHGAPHLWEAFYGLPSHPSVLEALRLLRNTIHAEGLESVAVQKSNSVVATWIVIPRSNGQEIADAASQTAPLADWGTSPRHRHFSRRPRPPHGAPRPRGPPRTASSGRELRLPSHVTARNCSTTSTSPGSPWPRCSSGLRAPNEPLRQIPCANR